MVASCGALDCLRILILAGADLNHTTEVKEAPPLPSPPHL
jgi:hypothetical protein